MAYWGSVKVIKHFFGLHNCNQNEFKRCYRTLCGTLAADYLSPVCWDLLFWCLLWTFDWALRGLGNLINSCRVTGHMHTVPRPRLLVCFIVLFCFFASWWFYNCMLHFRKQEKKSKCIFPLSGPAGREEGWVGVKPGKNSQRAAAPSSKALVFP